MARRSATLAAGVALALGLTGCVSTSMSAAEVRVPVLLGPVPCVGCRPAARLPAPAPLAQIAGRRRAYDFFFPSYLWGLADDSQLGISADRLLYWTPCRDDLQLSNLRAHAWQITVPFLIYISDASVEADAREMTVPGASCRSP